MAMWMWFAIQAILAGLTFPLAEQQGEDRRNGSEHREPCDPVLMAADAYQVMDLTGLANVAKPCMVQIGWGYFLAHMVTVLDANPETVTLGDPLRGTVAMPTSEFMRTWKGKVIWLSPRGNPADIN